MSEEGSYRQILLPRVVDDFAKSSPTGVFARVLGPRWREEGPTGITYYQLARAVDQVSFWLDETLGPAEKDKVFAYHGANDLRYAFLLVAAVKTRRRVVIPDGRLTEKARESLLWQTNCWHWIGSDDKIQQVNGLNSQRPGMKFHVMPPVEHWLANGSAGQYPFNVSFDEVKDDLVWVIHTSGTTGTPKALVHSNAWISTLQHHAILPDGSIENKESPSYNMIGKTSLCAAPPQWLAGMTGTLVWPLFWRFAVVVPPVDAPQPLPASLVDEIHQKVEVEGGFYMPSILKEMCSDPGRLERLRRLKYIQFGGAPLDKWVGDLLCEHVSLVPLIGSTEAAALLLRTPENPKDWNGYWFDPRTGVEMDPEGDGLYELVIRRRPEWERYQGIFIGKPGLDVYRFNDLYTKHPAKGELAVYSGRKDDLFKLSWLAKVRAKDIESVLDRLPTVRSALVGGEGRRWPFLLVELKQHVYDKNQQQEIVEEIWTELEKVNGVNVAEARVPKRGIFLSDPKRPFERLAKGTLDRRSILKSYEQDIELMDED